MGVEWLSVIALLSAAALAVRLAATKRSGKPAKREGSTRRRDEAPAARTDAAAPATPLGARLRPASDGYSLTLGQMEEVTEGLRQIPPFPQAVLRVTRELDSGESSAETVAETIASEPVLTASLLRIANSAAVGLRREVVTVAEAVAYLGFSTTRALFLRLQIGSLLPQSNRGGYDSQKLWIHSMAVAHAAEELARRVGATDPQLALTAGLLHDIGKVAINCRFPEKVRELWTSGAPADESFLDRERRIFGADHAAIGAILAVQWKLPAELAEMIRAHHLPQDRPPALSPEACRALLCVFVANQLVKYCHVYCENMEIDPIPDEVAAELGSTTQIESLLDPRMRQIIDRAAQLTGGAAETSAPVANAA